MSVHLPAKMQELNILYLHVSIPSAHPVDKNPDTIQEVNQLDFTQQHDWEGETARRQDGGFVPDTSQKMTER